MKTREEREKDLLRLAETNDGTWKLTDMARTYLGIPQEETIPRTTLLIFVILQSEYPNNAP
jgi:hypothetical protein